MHVTGTKITVALTVTTSSLAYAPPSGRNVTVAPGDVAVPVTPLTVHSPLAAPIVTGLSGVPLDAALTVQPEIDIAAVPAEAGAAAMAAVAENSDDERRKPCWTKHGISLIGFLRPRGDHNTAIRQFAMTGRRRGRPSHPPGRNACGSECGVDETV